MPRNGSGVFSLASTYEAISGEVIEAQQHNDPLEDLEQDANAARPIVAGGTGAVTAEAARTALFGVSTTVDNTIARYNGTTGALQASTAAIDDNGNLTLTSTDADAAAAPVLNLYRNSASPAASDIIGEVNFQGEDSAENTEDYAKIYGVIDDPTSTSEDASLLFRTKVAGTMTTRMSLTADGLVLPQGTTPTPTAEGAMQWDTDDNAIVIGDGSGQKVFRANPWEVIYDAAVSAVASVPVTGLSAFRTIKVIFSVKPANDGETFLFQTDANGGASWDTGASDYAFGIRYAAAGAALSVDSGAHSGIYCNYGTTVGSDTIEGLCGEFTFYDFNQATNMRVIGWSAWYNTASSIGEIVRITAVRANTSARDSLRLIGAGNIASGRVTILGLRG